MISRITACAAGIVLSEEPEPVTERPRVTSIQPPLVYTIPRVWALDPLVRTEAFTDAARVHHAIHLAADGVHVWEF